jgi:hypothetical protein
MMVTRNLLRVVVVTLLFAGVVYAQEGWKFPDFSATQVLQGRRVDMPMKIFVSGTSLRVDRSAAISTLYVNPANKIYSLTSYPDNSHQCVSMNPEQARMLPSPLEIIQGRIVKRVAAGTEVVEGHPTKIEDVTVVGIDGKTIKSRVWEAKDLKGIPVKIETYLKTTTLRAVYRDVVVGTPDKALFEVPSRCTPFEKMWQVAEAKELK